jgi:hypothetical protein
MRRVPLPPEIEEYRDIAWRRESTSSVHTVLQAEQFVQQVGFAACLTDARQPGPSLYVAVCGRRDAIMPRNVQKDPESSHTWQLKDEMLRRGRVYYGKLARGKATFVSREMIPYFAALWRVQRRNEKQELSKPARAILKVLRKEWEMATQELRDESGIADRKMFLQAIDELQKAMVVIPNDVLYEPRFTYLWGLAEERFERELSRRVDRNSALREVARCFLRSAGLTLPGELARVTGLSRPDAGAGNHALVDDGCAERTAYGTYRWVEKA